MTIYHSLIKNIIVYFVFDMILTKDSERKCQTITFKCLDLYAKISVMIYDHFWSSKGYKLGHFDNVKFQDKI